MARGSSTSPAASSALQQSNFSDHSRSSSQHRYNNAQQQQQQQPLARDSKAFASSGHQHQYQHHHSGNNSIDRSYQHYASDLTGSSPRSRSSGGDKRACFCRLLFWFFFVGLVAGAVILLVWQLVLVDHDDNGNSSNTNPQSNNSNNNNSSSSSSNNNNNNNNNNSTSSNTTTFQFMQCSDQAIADGNCCNGLEGLCDFPANAVLYGGLHNAMSSVQDGFVIAPNHDLPLELALPQGYRAVNLDISVCDGKLLLIHGYCQLGFRDPLAVFTNITTFMKQNPTEVILLVMELDDQTGGSDVSLQDLDTIMQQSGITDLMYRHPTTNSTATTTSTAWPTLRTLIELDQRIIFAFYNGYETCHNTPCPSYFEDWFDIAVESQYSFSDISQLRNTNFSCQITRGLTGTQDFWGLNAFVTLPSKTVQTEINSPSFMNQYIENCTEFYASQNRSVNVVWVDFWNTGNVPQVVQEHNQNLIMARTGGEGGGVR